jgi:hypothetical protein
MTTRLRVGLLAACALLAAALVAGAYHRLGSRRTPAGQPPLARLDSETYHEFRDAFNAADGRTRLVAMLSPT